ncbi:MAG: molybdopterin-synthase adenylyltransferase MoeB [Deltaproteobacteria bacterium]|nr:molybdopterin-synthase adenylyltransferase MoeB [Deltaproteobacteria bacterium]
MHNNARWLPRGILGRAGLPRPGGQRLSLPAPGCGGGGCLARLTSEDLLAQARAQVTEVDAAAVRTALAGPAPPLLLDVREQDEVDQGSIPGACHLPRGLLELSAAEVLPDVDAPVVVYCAAGIRSLLAAHTLVQLGYRHVQSLAGGFPAWKAAGGAVRVPTPLSREDRARYARHLSLPEVGEEGQRKLLAARVLVVGAGGLGSPCLYYLAAAGVGTLGVVDDDAVDVSNLQRQILHRTADAGTPKVDSAARALTALNPGLRVDKHAIRLTADNAVDLLRGYDVVVDGTDNFPTRYLLNDASVILRKPVVHGSVFRFEGQVSVFFPGAGPCYRCLYPAPPPADLAPSCVEGGVLGVLPGVVGTLQATETLKLLLGRGTPLIGRLLQFDALALRFRETRLRADPACPACGKGATLTQPLEERASGTGRG